MAKSRKKSATGGGPARRSVIITFRRKDDRPDPGVDKLELFESSISSEVTFFDSGSAAAAGVAAGIPGETIGLDINQYEAPIVTASLTDEDIDALRKNRNVATVEDDGLCFALPAGAPEAFVFEGQPSVLAETVPSGVAQIKAPAAWDATRAKGVRVAVLDTGIDGVHPDLAPNYKGGVSFVPGQSAADGNGHGTHCAGTIAAAINGVGVVGVAPAASLYAVKVLSNLGSGQWSWLIAGIDWCIQNQMHVLSMSLGGQVAPAALDAMCQAAWKKGLLLVAAAGNDHPSPVNAPARFASVVAVSAIDSSNVIASFSCRGAKVELCAPGVDVLSTLPGNRYGRFSGTSMACPHVAGTAALAWGTHRYSDNVTIRRLLAWTSDNLGIPGRDPLFGFGRADADQASGEFRVPPPMPGIP